MINLPKSLFFPINILFSSHQERWNFNEFIHPSVLSLTKRLIDIVGSIVGLMITGIVFIPITLAMQLDDPGPVFYHQTRCGLHGKPFKLWKFRSMIVDAEQKQYLVPNQAEGHIFKNDQDPRVTRVGKFLRRTSLDELPQFWNVLQGDMSLVGTRPPTVKEVRQYHPHHFSRLKVKPGLTGEWQVNGRSTVKNFEDIVSMDLDYQRKWSIWYDIFLICQTFIIVFTGKGAC